jgi:hypothetical protein
VTGWSGGGPVTTSPGPTLYAASSGTIQKTFTFTPAHYKIRILVSMWITDSAANDANWTKIVFKDSGNNIKNTISNSNLSIAYPTGSGYQIYPSGYRAVNIDN